MIGKIIFLLKLAVSFLPFILFAFFNAKANVKREVRNRQYPMPVVALIYSVVVFFLLNKISNLLMSLFWKLADVFDKFEIPFFDLSIIGNFIRDIYTNWGIYLSLVLFNTAALLAYIILKRIVTLILGKIKIRPDTLIGRAMGAFYTYDEQDEKWYIRDHLGQARTFIKTIYYATCAISGVALLASGYLCSKNLIRSPFYPVFAIIIIGEIAFFLDGLRADEKSSSLSMQADRSKHVAMYPLLRKPLRALFGDKLSAEGTTLNNGGASGNAVEDILIDIDKNGGHIGENYAAFIRRKMETGLKPNMDYVRCGYDLSVGKSLLFNTPFYDKLNPYVFYAMNRELLTGGKVMIVLGRHGTENDLLEWAESGMRAVSNIPGLWNISVLTAQKNSDDSIPDIGIITRSGVHDLDIHKNNLEFLRNVSFVIVVEPSRLVTTAQIGLNLLIKCCGQDRQITFCSIDRNCDGLVDALSHILMTNITEVSATEYPHGMSSYMYWTADDDYLQHRILPGVSRYLGMGTELSAVALKNQVKKTVWYGGDVFPVLDARWIAKQYYYDLLEYAQLSTNQETFDKCFLNSFNMCNERVSDYSYITVEDDRNNLFETRRNFATIAEEQGFINVISSEYMLREYMSENAQMFTADAKAIPYITADYARTKRNVILSLCLLLCIDSVKQDVLNRQMIMLNIDTEDPVSVVWKEICSIFSSEANAELDKTGQQILSVKTRDGKTVRFEKNKTIIFKREYSVDTGKFESVYKIENSEFSRIILDDLQNASYIPEQENRDVYIGTELKGHVYQKYLPGQFFTLNGKYYEMVSIAVDNRILVRRASEHISGRLSYRQVRNYTIHGVEESDIMGSQKTVNNIDIHYQYADFSVETPGYWKLHAFNNFDDGDLVTVNGVPTREYHHKQILKFDFSKLGDAFTDSVRITLTNLLNEVFLTLFAENQPFISAITLGSYDAPITYSLSADEGCAVSDKCIYIVEDSQLDIGLLVAVERNAKRIFQIISDYLEWNDEMIDASLNPPPKPEPEVVVSDDTPKKKKGIFSRIGTWFKGLFRKKSKAPELQDAAQDYMMIYGRPFKLVKGKWVACSQEEFDAKMEKRHRIIDENKQAIKAAKEAEKAAAKEGEEGATVVVEVEDTEASDTDDGTSHEPDTAVGSEEASATTDGEAPDAVVAPDAEAAGSSVIPDSDAVSSSEDEAKPAKLNWFQRLKAGKQQKKAADAQADGELADGQADGTDEKAAKKAAKAEAKAAKQAAKAEAKAARAEAKKAAKEEAKAAKKAAKAGPVDQVSDTTDVKDDAETVSPEENSEVEVSEDE